MQDRVPKGNSRDSNFKLDLTGINSWEDFVIKNNAGALFADVFENVTPNDGASVQGTPLNKSILLDDSTANLLNLGTDPTVNEALAKLLNATKTKNGIGLYECFWGIPPFNIFNFLDVANNDWFGLRAGDTLDISV